MSFANQVTIITGASSGIGWSLARELARQGARVGVTARREPQLKDLVEEIRKAGGTAEYVVGDIADRAAVNAAVAELTRRLGPVDLMVANAGLGMPTKVDPMNVEGLEQMFRVNVFGVIYSLEAVLPQMIARKKGHVAAVSSMAAYKGLPGESGYCSTKAAVNNFMEGLRMQLYDRGIAVTTICPGFVTTPMTEKNNFHMPWLMSADKAARLIAKALARKKKVFGFPWQMNLLMWATRWLPDWFILRQVRPYGLG